MSTVNRVVPSFWDGVRDRLARVAIGHHARSRGRASNREAAWLAADSCGCVVAWHWRKGAYEFQVSYADPDDPQGPPQPQGEEWTPAGRPYRARWRAVARTWRRPARRRFAAHVSTPAANPARSLRDRIEA